MFARVWIGCNCPGGETWHVAYHQECDLENDEVYQIPYCTICMASNIKEKKTEQGIEVWHALTSDELFIEMMYPDPYDDLEMD